MFSSRKYGTLLVWMALTAAAMLTLSTGLDRPLWFDEAVSLMNFATLPYPQIYSDYAIPNNHILFNMILKTWLETIAPMLSVGDVQFRVPAVIIALTTLSAMFALWRRRLGGLTAFIACLSFAVSTPFAIYGTALRGYMLSILLVTLGLEFSLRWRERRGKTDLAFYSLSALAAVAVIPTNLLAFAAITFAPPCDIDGETPSGTLETLWKIFKKRLILGVLPVAAFLLFYGPLCRSLVSALRHNNGWLSPLAACGHLYAGFCVSSLPLLVLAVFGLKKSWKNGDENRVVGVLLTVFAFLLPALVTLVRIPAPFPRVFLPFWPIWLFLTGLAVKKALPASDSTGSLPFGASAKFAAALCAATLACGALSILLAPKLSAIFTKKHSQDDFFSPYFMRKTFDPLKTVNTAARLANGESGRVFLSQNCDFPSIIFYGKLKGLPVSFWLFDSPGKPSGSLKTKGEELYIVARGELDLSLISKRFGIEEHAAVPLDQAGGDRDFQRIYVVSTPK